MEYVVAGTLVIIAIVVVIIAGLMISGKRNADKPLFEEDIEGIAEVPTLSIEDSVLLNAATDYLCIETAEVSGVVAHYVIVKRTGQRLYVIDKHTYEITPVVRRVKRA